MHRATTVVTGLAGLLIATATMTPSTLAARIDVQRLVAAYPEQLSHVDGNHLVWRDGTRMTIDDGHGGKTLEQRLSRPDLKDMLVAPYPPGRAGLPPAGGDLINSGRVRHAAFFAKMYGDCEKGTVAANLAEIVWLANTAPQKLKVTRINGVDRRLAAISSALEALPRAIRKVLTPAAGTYACRPIAGTGRISAHGYGIAIDIALTRADYWRWQAGKRQQPPAWRNRIPLEIVEIFERHGFIWGGKWLHYDTMHFEFRPELLPVEP